MMEYSFGFTSSINLDENMHNKLISLSKIWNAPYILREKKTIEDIKEKENLKCVLVLDKQNRLRSLDPLIDWHPSMSVPRLHAIMDNKGDRLLEALDIHFGDKVLDCTLGYGADAIIEAYGVGETGEVTGLEVSPAICAVTKWGLSHRAYEFNHKKAPVGELSKRIKVININSLSFLKEQGDNSFDVIYFDPMFKVAVDSSASMNNLRSLACYDHFTKELLEESLRVAKRRVVVKERAFSKVFETLKADYITGGKYSNIHYGVWEVKK